MTIIDEDEGRSAEGRRRRTKSLGHVWRVTNAEGLLTKDEDEGRRTKDDEEDEGRGRRTMTKDEGRRTSQEGRGRQGRKTRTNDEGRRTMRKVEGRGRGRGRRTMRKVEGRMTKDEGRWGRSKDEDGLGDPVRHPRTDQLNHHERKDQDRKRWNQDLNVSRRRLQVQDWKLNIHKDQGIN